MRDFLLYTIGFEKFPTPHWHIFRYTTLFQGTMPNCPYRIFFVDDETKNY